MKIYSTLIVAALAALPAWQCAAGEENPRMAAAPANGHDDAELAAKGKMGLRAALLALPRVQHGQPRHHLVRSAPFSPDDKARFVHSVTEGKNGRMPPWGDLLKADEVEELWAYVKTGGAQ